MSDETETPVTVIMAHATQFHVKNIVRGNRVGFVLTTYIGASLTTLTLNHSYAPCLL